MHSVAIDVGSGQLGYLNAGVVIERLQVRIPAGTAGKSSSPFFADSYAVSVPSIL